MRIVTLVLAVAVLAATPALAQTDPVAPPASDGNATAQDNNQPAAAPETQTTQDPDEEVICRTVQRAESRLRSRRERICGTRTQWEMMADQNARDVRMIGSGSPPSN